MSSEKVLDKIGAGIPLRNKRLFLFEDEKDFKFDISFFEKFTLGFPGVLYVHDLILDKYFFLNNSLEQRLGYKKKSFNPMSKKMLSDLMHPDDFLQYDAFIHQVSKSTSRKFFESEYRLKTNTGNWRWFLSKETVYQRDSNNNVSKIFGIATEVTSMKSAELKSKESRANLNALIESTSDIIYSIDNEFRIITMNSECRRNFSSNSGVEYYEGLNILTGLEEIRVKYFSDLFKRVLMGERVNYNYEYHVEGRIKDLEVTLNPVFNDDGIVISITCFAKDVTNYKTATKIIKEQNILLNSIIESTSSSVFAFDTEGRYIAFNALHKNTMKKIYDVDIKLGMNWTELLSEGADYEKSIRNWERGLAGESFTIVTEYGLGLPERPIYELSYTPIKDENETITGISIYSKDITKKVKDQELLLATERKFRDVFENSPDAIFVEDFAGNIIDVNPAGIVLQDLSKEKLIGLNIRNLVPKEKYVKILRDYKQLYFGVIKTLESSVWSASKGEIPVEITGKKIRYGMNEVFLLQVRDIRERKKMEEERAQIIIEKGRQKEEMMKASVRIQEEERNRIAAEMHDEIGAGLSKISILSQVIKKSFNDPETVASNVEKILQSSKEVQENIGEIIWAMDPKNDTVENLIAYINYYSSELLDTSSIELKISFPEKIPSVTLTGKIRRNIFLIIKESLNNIVRHSLASHVRLAISFENDVLGFYISDDGKGFNTEEVPRFRNGIINMKKRIFEIGGSFNMTSKLNEGTCIQLTIPVVSSKN